MHDDATGGLTPTLVTHDPTAPDSWWVGLSDAEFTRRYHQELPRILGTVLAPALDRALARLDEARLAGRARRLQEVA